ncbi:MAG TPA: Lrp/AsnC family transcriptional regulator [Hellea balneolensis]|uniref:Lrp/AsnC family transcriptional regulator n=1 Tax=Hellea balneolensis TaxID=287478 RepID=A0A7C3CCQ3_9PROT|nr:Lrp/AsnC family transcriptional regulator [Hellea balneolensis]
MRKLDQRDRALLNALQTDASESLSAIAERVGLSQNAAWRRVKALEEDGIIEGRYAKLSPDKLGLDLTVFVTIKTAQHTQDWLDIFAKGVAQLSEVVGFYRMSGDVDYLLKILVADMDGYDRVYKKLISIAPLADVSSSFAMERIKDTGAVPLDDIPRGDNRF